MIRDALERIMRLPGISQDQEDAIESILVDLWDEAASHGRDDATL